MAPRPGLATPHTAPALGVLLLLLTLPTVTALIPFDLHAPCARRPTTALQLWPLERQDAEPSNLPAQLWDKLQGSGRPSLFSACTVGLAHEDDLEAVTELLVEGLGVEEVLINQSEWSEWEVRLVGPAVNAINRVIRGITAAETRLGLQKRGRARLVPRPMAPQVGVSEGASLLLVAEAPDSDELLAVLELCLLQPDGRLASNLMPAAFDAQADRPYICNVVVAESARRRGVARELVQLAEQIAAEQWGYREVFLHVEESNVGAVRLYRTLGFRAVAEWTPNGQMPGWWRVVFGDGRAAFPGLLFLRKELHPGESTAAR